MFVPLPAAKRVMKALGLAARAMVDYRVPRDIAAISYFSLFAFFPAVLVILAIGNDILGLLEFEQKAVVDIIISIFPASRKFLDTNLSQITEPAPALVLSCVIIVAWTSTWVFTFLENALNRAWGVSKRRTFWQSRIRMVAVVLVGGTLLFASAAITAFVTEARRKTTDSMGYAGDQIISWLWSVPLLTFGFLLAVLVFFCIFKLMPDRAVSWREAISGALVSSTLWEGGSSIFVRIFPALDYERIYGQMGAIIALMAWIYTSNLIVLFGANFSAQLHRPGEGNRISAAKPDSSAGVQKRPPDNIRSFRRPR
jgi:membrane protein